MLGSSLFSANFLTMCLSLAVTTVCADFELSWKVRIALFSLLSITFEGDIVINVATSSPGAVCCKISGGGSLVSSGGWLRNWSARSMGAMASGCCVDKL